MVTKMVTPKVEVSLKNLEESICTFYDIEDILEHEDAEPNIASLEQTEVTIGKGSSKNPWYWSNSIDGDESEKYGDDPDISNESQGNKYYMPRFYQYLRNILLPQYPLWSKIVLQNLSMFPSKDYESVLQLPISTGNNIFTKNQTNATVENVFKTKKADKVKLPIPAYIKNSWVGIKGLQRQFIEKKF